MGAAREGACPTLGAGPTRPAPPLPPCPAGLHFYSCDVSVAGFGRKLKNPPTQRRKGRRVTVLGGDLGFVHDVAGAAARLRGS